MAVSVVTLKTGDRVITELKEIFDGEGEDKRGSLPSHGRSIYFKS